MEKYGSCLILFIAWMQLVSLVTGTVMQNPQGGPTTNYAVDLYSNAISTTGYISISPILFSTSTHTIEIQSFSRLGFQCLLSMGTVGTENYFALQEDGGYVAVRVGFPNLPNFSLATSAAPIISFNTWNSISVVIRNINSTNALVSAFVNGTLVIDNAPTLNFPTGWRGNVTLGACPDQQQGPEGLNGLVDNFRVWNTARTAAEIQSVFTSLDLNDNLTSVMGNNNLIAFYPFTEGRGLLSRDMAPGSTSTAQISTNVWSVKYLGDLHRVCSSTDSGVSIFIPNTQTLIYEPPQLLGQWQHSSCGPNFIVRVFRAPRDQWDENESCDVVSCGPTIVNALTVKAFDEVFYLDVDGNLAARTLDGEFVSLATSSVPGTRPSGVRFIYEADRFFLQVPTVGFMDVGLSPLARGGIQSNAGIQHTTYCEAISGITGLCDNVDEQLSWGKFLFLNESFCNDQYVSGSEQCDGSMSCTANCTCAAGTDPVGGLCLDVCGNGIITGLEQCERTYGCVECQCKPGTRPVNGKCIDECGDGLVTGAEQCDGGSFCEQCKCLDGFRPTSPLSQSCERIPVDFIPSIVPTLDCLNLLESGSVAQLHFSYDNLDGFEQTIEHGEFNDFIPEDVATSRPTFFSSGKSLTYPLSPYATKIMTTVNEFTWILGSFNLTVDLTNPTRYQCPTAPAIEIVLTTSTNLTSDKVQTIIDNLADMYDIDPSRINVTVVVNSTTVPPTYTLIIVINNPTNATERGSAEVIRDLFDDLKDDEDDTKAGIIEGIDDVEIKEITTRPTGVEVRGQPATFDRDPFVPSVTNTAAVLVSSLWITCACFVSLV